MPSPKDLAIMFGITIVTLFGGMWIQSLRARGQREEILRETEKEIDDEIRNLRSRTLPELVKWFNDLRRRK